MDFIELAKKRYSVRAYQQKEVESQKLDTILQAGRVAPTAANKQPNHFLILNTPESMEKLSKGTNAHGAPLVIIVCGDQDAAWVRPFDGHSMADVDASIAADHMMMCAEDLGLSSCWITYFDPAIISKEFNIPSSLSPINILAVGYSADQTPQSPKRHEMTRKPLKAMISYNAF